MMNKLNRIYYPLCVIRKAFSLLYISFNKRIDPSFIKEACVVISKWSLPANVCNRFIRAMGIVAHFLINKFMNIE